MNIQQLLTFVTLVEYKTLKEVSNQLHIRQPTVYFHLKNLEEKYPFALFKSGHSKTTELTKEGRVLYHQAKQIISLLDKTSLMMEDFAEKRMGSLSIGSTYTPATYMILPTISRFKTAYPNANLSVEVKPANVLIDKLKNFEIDLAIFSYNEFNDAEMHADKLIKEDLQLLLHPDHKLAGKQTITASDLNNQPFILHEKGSLTRSFVDNWLNEYQLKVNEVMELSSTETMKEAVKNQLGIAIVSISCAMEEQKNGKLAGRPIPNFEVNRYIYVGYHKRQVLTDTMESFLNMLKEDFESIRKTRVN
ncbi:LysR family transcriptional regulator [Virgibacillus oceani]